MQDIWLERTELLIGSNKLNKLKNKHILIVGIGGVGAYAAEMICRAGVGYFTLVDADTISPSNINRQLPAMHSTIDKGKAETMKLRLMDINPQVKVTVIEKFFLEEDMYKLMTERFDYIVDAIDTLSPKAHLIYQAIKHGYPIVSSMGAGGKIDPSMVQIARVEKSYNCNLARMLRKRLRKLGINGGFPVVFSPEDVNAKAVIKTDGKGNKKSNIGTISYLPPLFGILCASQVIRDLLKTETNSQITN